MKNTIEVVPGINGAVPEGPFFHLRFGPSSYIFSVLDGVHLAHRYWGPRIETEGSPLDSTTGVAGLAELLDPPVTAPYLTTVDLGESARFSPDLLPREYPSWGTGDMRSPAWLLRRGDGSTAGALRYRGYAVFRDDRVVDGDPGRVGSGPGTAAGAGESAGPSRPPLRPRGLPWIRPGAGGEPGGGGESNAPGEGGDPFEPGAPVEPGDPGDAIVTLRVDCEDPVGGLDISLYYTVVEGSGCPVLLRWTRIVNTGTVPLDLDAAASCSVDLPPEHAGYDLVTLDGAWSRERTLLRRRVSPGIQQVESRGGASGHQHAPFLALLHRSTTEVRGNAWGISLVYSGNHCHLAEQDQYGSVRLQAGINPLGFAWRLDPGESFDTPAVVLAWSDEGLNGLSDQLHRFVRTALLPREWRERDRPIVVNTWEAYYFDVDARKVAALAREGASLGAELLVLDDGWFRGRRDDTVALGDWTPDAEKFPAGLAPVAEDAGRAGLRFGIWIEPEMVSPESDLYREHPDWALHIPGRDRTLARNQLVLDLANPAVVDHLEKTFADLLQSVPIEYVKWDMNRNMSEPGSPHLPADRQGEVMHRYMLGLYDLLERLTTRFPEVLIEGCAGGGGRFDYGMLCWAPQYWTSDQTDAIERLAIQRGSSLLFPPETMGAHVSASPNHLLGRTTPAWTRVVVALAFNFGFELDLLAESEDDCAVYRRATVLYRRYRRFFREGRFLRLLPETAGDITGVVTGSATAGDYAWSVVSRDARRAMIFHVSLRAPANRVGRRIRPVGLDPRESYRVVPILPDGGEETSRAAPVPGAALMHRGIAVPQQAGDYQAHLWELVSDRSDPA